MAVFMNDSNVMGLNFSTRQEPLDRYLNCADCGCDFVFSSSEQKYFIANNVTSAPSRCHNCRAILRSKNSARRSGGTLSAVVCASCHALTYVPYKPTGLKPIYCGSCLFNPDLELCV